MNPELREAIYKAAVEQTKQDFPLRVPSKSMALVLPA